ncbi:hypothetical protein C0580_01440 [Candidatus Parcubacteria bacterium]|nr:MAG: hypothetical protein C0580_01440 [Candidatus Parcubacteria bacterium]
MAEDPIKSSGGAPEERGPEQNSEQQENAQELLARRSRELKDMVADIREAGDPELDHALFARLERIIADFDQTAPRILEQESGDEAKAKERIDQRFDSSKNDVMQSQEFLSRPVANKEEVGPDTAPEEEVQTEPKPPQKPEPKKFGEDEEESDDADGSTFEEQIENVGVSLRESEPEAETTSEPEAETTTTTTPSPEGANLEDLESDLGYLHLEPNKIFENLSPEMMEGLRSEMMAFRVAEGNLEQARIELAREQGKKKSDPETIETLQQKVDELTADYAQKLEALNNFYKERISAVLAEQGKEDALDEEALQSVAERINAVVLDTIALEANRNSIDSKAKGVLKQMLKNMPIMAGTALAIGSAGLALPITGVLVGGSSWILRRLMSAREKSKAGDARLNHREKVNEAKTVSTERLFTDLEGLRKQLSGHISNALRQETSQKAIERLQVIEYVGEEDVMPPEIIDDVSREFYFSALAQVEAKHPDLPQEQRLVLAINMAMNLAQHQRNKSEAADRLAAIREQKPGLYKLIEKYNLLASGRLDAPPEGMTEEEKRVWGVSKHDLISLGVGASIGVAVRTSGIARAALGALSGGAMGYMIGEEMERKNQEKVFGEIKELLEEAESLIVDLSLSPDQVSELRRSRDVVQARLETGILDSNPLLKSRAENFVANFQRIELSGVSGFGALMARIGQNTAHLQEQVEYDLSRIEKASKRRKLAATIGGTIVGAAAGFFGSDVSKKALEEIGDTDVGEKVDDILDGAKEKIGMGDENIEATPKPEEAPVDTSADTDPNRPAWGRPLKYVHGQGYRESGPPIEDLPTTPEPASVDPVSTETGQVNAAEAPKLQPEPEVPPAPTKFTDTIDSSEVRGSDSIWRSTKGIFLRNAQELGYEGDDAGLDKWAETQTANAVAELNESQGGNLKDLVHDDDLVHLEKGEDGKWHLSVEEASGKEAGHLSDTNVNKFFDGTRFEGDVEHTQTTDPITGDEYWEIKSGEDVYKVYDWDRDGRPNVLMPDGSSAEMSVEEMKAFFQEKNIAFTQQEIDAVAAAQRFDQYTGGGGGQYEQGMYQMAQGSPEQANALFKQVLESNDQGQIESYIKDDLQAHGFSPSKSQVFLATLKDGGNIDSTLNGAIDGASENPTQTMDDLRNTFESSVKTSYDAIRGVDDKEWHPIKLGEKYFLAYKYHERFWPIRSDHFYLSDGSLDGDGSYIITEHLDDHAMKDFFEHGPEDNAAPQEVSQASPQTEVNPKSSPQAETPVVEQTTSPEANSQTPPVENTKTAVVPPGEAKTDFEPVKTSESIPEPIPRPKINISPEVSTPDTGTEVQQTNQVEPKAEVKPEPTKPDPETPSPQKPVSPKVGGASKLD